MGLNYTNKTWYLFPKNKNIFFNSVDGYFKATEVTDLRSGDVPSSATLYPLFTIDNETTDAILSSTEPQYLIYENDKKFFKVKLDDNKFLNWTSAGKVIYKGASISFYLNEEDSTLAQEISVMMPNNDRPNYTNFVIQSCGFGFFIVYIDGDIKKVGFYAGTTGNWQKVNNDVNILKQSIYPTNGSSLNATCQLGELNGNVFTSNTEVVNILPDDWFIISETPYLPPTPQEPNRLVELNGEPFKCLEGTLNEQGSLDIASQSFDALAYIDLKRKIIEPASELIYQSGVGYEERTEENAYKITIEHGEIDDKTLVFDQGTFKYKLKPLDGEETEESQNFSSISEDDKEIGVLTYIHYMDSEQQNVVGLVLIQGLGNQISYAGSRVTLHLTGTKFSKSIPKTNELAQGLMLYPWGDLPPAGDTDDPYEGGGFNKPEGGGGDFDDTSDDIVLPPVDEEINGTLYTGMLDIYNPTIEELISFATYLFNREWTTWGKKFYNDPADMIIALNIVPYTPTVYEETADIIIADEGVGVNTHRCKYAFETIDFGDIDITKFYDAKWDYAPYTKLQIYLPFIGYKDLDIDEVMGTKLNLKYRIDNLTGACVAYISDEHRILYSFNGNCASSIPLTSRNMSELRSAIINGATNLIGATIGGAVAGSAFGVPAAGVGALTGAISAGTSMINNTFNAKPQVSRNGNLSVNNGIMSVQTPYLIYKIPRQNFPSDYSKQFGYPSNMTNTLGYLTGYTKVRAVHLENIPCTSNELDEIMNLLQEGVII